MTERQRQERRIKRFIKNAESRGFEFDTAYVSAIIKTIPENDLNKITPNVLYSLATYVDEDTGEILSGTEGRKLERQKAAYKGQLRKKQAQKARTSFVDIVIRNYRRQILGFPKKVADIVLDALDNAINLSGREAVATRLENNAESLSDYLNRSKLFGDSISAIISYCQAMFGDLPGMTNEDVINVSDILDGLESYETT
jgi:hypothetical protein